MTRARSEHRLGGPALPRAVGGPTDLDGLRADPAHAAGRGALAELLLAAYQGTIDDEGEDLEDAQAAIDHYLGLLAPEHSVVLSDGDGPVAVAFVVWVGGRPYIDPVATRPDRKRRGVGSAAVRAALRSLASGGAAEVGAVITDGNVASERLFGSLGFVRVGPWG